MLLEPNYPKLNSAGPDYPMDKTWKRLIPLSLSKKRTNNNSWSKSG